MNEEDKLTSNVILRVKDSGSNMLETMNVEFSLCFAGNKENCIKGQELAKSNGFLSCLELDEEFNEWMLYCIKSIILNLNNIKSNEKILKAIASKFDASYEGFETSGNKNK